MNDERQQYCTFTLGDHWFGIDARAVQEVLMDQVMTRVPLAPAVVPGVLNLRGDIVTTIDLRGRLDVEPRAEDARPTHVVVSIEEEPVSFLVDEVGEVIEARPDNFEPPPDTLQGVARDIIKGTQKLESSLLLILDIERAAAIVQQPVE